jgi:hypothetical protein
VVAFFAFYGVEGWRPFESLDLFDDVSAQARALTFVGIVAGQVGCLFAQRDGSLRSRLSLKDNRWILVGIATEIVVVLALVYTPGFNGLFEMEAVPPAWMLLLPLGAAVFVVLDVIRRFVAARVLVGRAATQAPRGGLRGTTGAQDGPRA